jgi:aminoglycoside phosphotransferase (APT) family kinase protein
VIDWGDVCLADPALDLSISFTFLPRESWPEFRAAYGEIDGETWERARFRALFYGAVLTHYGASAGDEPIRHAGELALRNALPQAGAAGPPGGR